jgi:hypothetical protein
MTTRLIFSDSLGHTKSFSYDEFNWLKFAGAFRTKFLEKHISEGNTTFSIERPDDGEILRIETAVGIASRTRGGADGETQYCRFGRNRSGDLASTFAAAGYAGLDAPWDWVAWTPDRESLLPESSFVNHELEDVQAKVREAERRRAIRALPKLDRKQLKTFCTAWADHGHNEYDGADVSYHVLFDGRSLGEVSQERPALLATIAALGLEVVPTPAASADGEIWVRADPRVDLELEKW